MELIKVKINGITVSAPKGSTILEAARLAHIKIPTLCYLKEINEIGACRICVVEVKGARNLIASCVYPITEGMEILTNTPKVINSRKKTLQLLLSNHKRQCLSCIRNGECELQSLCKELQVDNELYYDGELQTFHIDTSSPHMYRDNNKCILCRRCTSVCSKVQNVSVIGANERGFHTYIGSAFDMDLNETSCVSCGQCIAVCPTGALSEKDQTNEVFKALSDPSKYVIVQTAPAVRASLGESFGYPIGTNVQGQMIAALHRIGFKQVFDTNFGADLTIMEESTEFLKRFFSKEKLPLITSCSPGWIKYCEYYHPDLLANLSTCKSPQQMFGAIIKTYYAPKIGISAKDIVVVSVMPCTAKKFEITRENQAAAKTPDVDITLTVRELARMIRQLGLNFKELPPEPFDSPFGSSTGASVIFGTTGGVMEAALRTAVWKLTGETSDSPIEFHEVRGLQGIKEATYQINGETIKVAIASGLANANVLLQKIKKNKSSYQFIEIMGCPGGCVNGGGQPFVSSDTRNFVDFKQLRASVLYKIDQNHMLRRSYENQSIQVLYNDFLGKPGSDKAHSILHTTYQKRNIN